MLSNNFCYLELVMANKLNENSIREAAYYLWQNAGCPFWSKAVEQLNSKSSCKKSLSSKTSTAKKTMKKSK